MQNTFTLRRFPRFHWIQLLVMRQSYIFLELDMQKVVDIFSTLNCAVSLLGMCAGTVGSRGRPTNIIWLQQIFCVSWVYSNFVKCATATRWLLWHSDFTKFDFGPGSAQDPAGGTYDAPHSSHPLDPFSVWCRRLWRRCSVSDPLKFKTRQRPCC